MTNLNHVKPILEKMNELEGPYKELIALSALGYEEVVTSLVDEFTAENIAEFIVFFQEEGNMDPAAISLLKDLHDSLVYNTIINDDKKFYVFPSGRIVKIKKKTKIDEFIRIHYFCEEYNCDKYFDITTTVYHDYSHPSLQWAIAAATLLLKDLYPED